jgi:perosamine synthetase
MNNLMGKRISTFLIKGESTIKEAMRCINRGKLGIALIVDGRKRLLGVVTDKDIREALLSGKDFNFPIREIMTRNPVVAHKDMPITELLKLFLVKKVHQIPIVDKDRKVVDIATLSELKNIPLSAPDITHKEVKIISEVLSTPYLSIGPKIKEFEKRVAKYIGTKYAVGVNSGTSGLHLCIKALDIKDGDEVITSPFSFIASANCILFERAKPVFVDIDESALCIDPERIEEKITPKTKAILPVHIFGHPCRMDKIMDIARKNNLAIIEDSCEAIGAEFDGKKVGSFGNVGVFGFYPNKQITTAEGGMIVTDDEDIAALCRSMRNQGREDETNGGETNECFKRLGYNYRMSELSAALGVSQMERIEEILRKRQIIAELYNERLKDIEEVTILYNNVESNVKISWFVYITKLDYNRFSKEDRDKILMMLRFDGIKCKGYFLPIHLQPFYKEMFGYKEGDFPVTERVSGATIALPFYNNLKESQIDYICDRLKKAIKEVKKL